MARELCAVTMPADCSQHQSIPPRTGWRPVGGTRHSASLFTTLSIPLFSQVLNRFSAKTLQRFSARTPRKGLDLELWQSLNEVKKFLMGKMVVWGVVWWLRTNTDHVLLWLVIGSVNWSGVYQEHFPQESYHTTPCCVFCGSCEEVHKEWSRAEDTIWESPSLSLKSRWIFHHVEQPGVRVLSPNAIVSLLLSPLSRRTPRILYVDVWTTEVSDKWWSESNTEHAICTADKDGLSLCLIGNERKQVLLWVLYPLYAKRVQISSVSILDAHHNKHPPLLGEQCRQQRWIQSSQHPSRQPEL